MVTKAYTLSLARVGMGGLSQTKKMPCYSWSLSTSVCKTGGRLRKIKGSVCSKCYADKGNYNWPNVKHAHQERLRTYESDARIFVRVAITVLNNLVELGEEEFRWFDSGDLLSSDMLRDLIHIAREVPDMMFWLPTKEEGYVREYLSGTVVDIPSNLCIRLSTPMIGSQSSSIVHLKHPQVTRSYVGVEGNGIFQCPAPTQGNMCGSCRACWDPKKFVSYKEI